jgi:serine phosphatase RsbU (regulator of sigma subunit)
MGQAKQAVKVAASLQINDPLPVAVLDQTNKVIFLNNHHVEFTTAIYGVIDVANRKVTYASAGHHPPILAKPGEYSRIMPNLGFPLGVELNLPDLVREHSFIYELDTLLAAARTAVTMRAERPARYITKHVLQETTLHPDDVAVLTIFFE